MKNKSSDIQFKIHQGNEAKIAEVVLNRPSALNALSTPMITLLMDRLRCWEKDDAVAAVVIQSAVEQVFCAGGDISHIYYSILNQTNDAFDFFKLEYELNLQMAAFSKPIVSVIDGVAMGGGLGLCIHGSHRVGGKQLMMAMPECRIGFVPDVGAGYFLSRMPGFSGLMMGLSSASIGWGDALSWGLLTHALPSSKIGSVVEVLSKLHWSDYPHQDVSQALNDMQEVFIEKGEFSSKLPMIETFFSSKSVAEIICRCMDGPSWARDLAKKMCGNYPLGMAVFFCHYHQMKDKCLLDDLKQTFVVTQNFLKDNNFLEGIRAAVIDKDRYPKWQGPGLNDISSEIIDSYFSDKGAIGLC